jgi:DNA-binding response OmpR family regulator
MSTKEASPLDCAHIALDVEARSLRCGERNHHLTPKECRLLEIFLLHQGQVLTRQFLMKEVWLTDYVADTRTLEVHVHWLRQKIEEGDEARLIHTVRSVGYILRESDS